MKYLILFVFINFLNPSISQTTIYSDLFYGGVTGGGYSSGLSDTGNGNIELHFEPNSVIRKAYLICQRYQNPKPTLINLNGTILKLDSTTTKNEFWILNSGHSEISGINILDVSMHIDPNQNIQTISFPPQNNNLSDKFFNVFYLMVSYTTPSSPLTNIQIVINNRDLEDSNFQGYSFQNLNPIDTVFDVGFGIHTDRLGDPQLLNDGSNIYFNSDSLGLIGGDDQTINASSGGVKGSFYYFNNQFFGLADDTANYRMDLSDGIAKVQNLINQNSNSCDFSLIWQDIGANTRYNIYTSFFLAYTTPCDTFSTSVSEQVTICEGDTAFLTASGGNNTLNSTYEWEPQEGLSCYNCPNPYYTDTLSKWYTVRIWNTDSCSKVIPVNIHINDNPPSPIVATSTTQCSDSTGVALVTVVDATYMYSANNSSPQISNGLSYLWGGNHLITVTDTNGCTADKVVNVPVYYPTAHFTASPLQGDVPLEVTFTNTSFSATYYVWYIDNDTLSSTNPTYTFNESGQFSATLIAYDTYPQCADTANISIFAEYPFTVFAPSFYAYQEDHYTIYTSGVKELNYTLYNSIGQQMYSTSYTNNTDAAQYLSLWSGYDLARGTYLYRIVAKGLDGSEKFFSGKVVLM